MCPKNIICRLAVKSATEVFSSFFFGFYVSLDSSRTFLWVMFSVETFAPCLLLYAGDISLPDNQITCISQLYHLLK